MSDSLTTRATRKTPMVNRSYGPGAAVFIIVLLGCGSATSFPPLESPAPLAEASKVSPTPNRVTEAVVLETISRLDPTVLVARQQAALADARRMGTGLAQNPVLSWEREAFFNGEREDALAVSVPVDISSQRSLRRRLANVDSASARADAADTQRHAVAAALKLFYAALAETERATTRERATKFLESSAEVIRKRKTEGQESGYELVRVELELELARSSLAEARGRRDALRSALASLLEIDSDDLVLVGDLTTTAAATGSPKTTPTSVKWRQAATEQARAAASKKGRLWIPMLSVTGGLRLGKATDSDSEIGYLAGIGLDVPIFSNRSALGAEAKVTAELAKSKERAAKRAMNGDLARAQAAYQATVAERERFDQATAPLLERLERATVSGYREGRRTIVELLDARRTRAAVEERQLELKLNTKQAEIAVRAASGEFE